MTKDWLKDKNTGQKFYPITHEDAVIDNNNVTLSTKLKLKQDIVKIFVGSMCRTNVAGAGSLSITGTSGQFPTIRHAGEYTVITEAESITSNYTLSITFGSNSYSLTSNNGIINDSRLLTLSDNSMWAGSITTVAANTKLRVSITANENIESISIVGTTGDYNDLGNLPNLSSKENISNKVTSISSSSTDTQYPSAKCVYDIVGDIETLLAAI